MFLFHSRDAEEILKYQKLLDNILNNNETNEEDVVIVPKKIKLGAPELPRAGIREPKLIFFQRRKK